MDSNLMYYLFIVAAIVVGIVIVKKVTSCLIKTVFLAALVALLAFVYFCYLR